MVPRDIPGIPEAEENPALMSMLEALYMDVAPRGGRDGHRWVERWYRRNQAEVNALLHLFSQMVYATRGLQELLGKAEGELDYIRKQMEDYRHQADRLSKAMEACMDALPAEKKSTWLRDSRREIWEAKT